jgi:hypothetical protein
MSWTRPCAAAAAPPGRRIADTGDCFDTLRIVVDAGRNAIVSVERFAGP